VLKPNSEPPSLQDLLTLYSTKCEATACEESCADLIVKLDVASPDKDDYDTFAETCKVENPAGGGGGGDDDKKDDGGELTNCHSKFLFLLILSLVSFYFTV
jgi:hypothetical protein